MNHRLTPISRAVQCALIASAAAGAGLTVTVANAQEEADILEEVVVTGSRLRRDRDFVEISPVATVGMDEIQNSGYLTLEQTVNRMPQLRPESTSNSNQYGGAAMSADLRGLGRVRTLVLVDGRRYIPAEITGVADLASIPDMMVQSAELVTGGASAVYGSDAIGGVVNFRLRNDIQGVTARYQRGASGYGDGETERADLLVGYGSDDGTSNVAFAFSWSERGTILGADRSFSAIPLFPVGDEGELVQFAAGNIFGNRVALNSAQMPLIKGVDLSNADGECPATDRIIGVRFGSGGQPLPWCRIRDGYNYAETNYLLRPIDRFQISAIGHHEINDRVEAYAQVFNIKYRQDYQMAADATPTTSAGYPRGTVYIPNAVNNPVFSPTLQSFWAQNAELFDPDGDGHYEVFSTGRRMVEFGPRHFDYTTNAFLATGGLRGDFDVGENNWTWDTFYQFSRNDMDWTLINLTSKSALALGLDVVVDEDGTASCRNPIRGCVPLNVFGTDVLTQEMVQFMRTERVTDYRFERTVAGATLAGDLFELPAGNVATAFGAEFREEYIREVPNDVQLRNDLTSQSIAPSVVEGDYNLSEVFGEARIPLLDNQMGLQGLALEGAARVANYSTVGSVSTWNLSLDMDVNEQLKIRAGYGTAIRAPNLDELLAPVGTGFEPDTDPCVTEASPSQAVKDLCVQQGVPANLIDTLIGSARQGYDEISGGNPNLSEEQADTLTAGFVLSPNFLTGLTMSMDYYTIEMTGAIAQVGGPQLISDCFTTLDINSASCQSIVRDRNGNILEVYSPLLNLADRNVDGLDWSASYIVDSVPDWLSLPDREANMDVQWFGSWQFTNSVQVLQSTPALDCAGKYSGACSRGATRPSPNFRGLLRANWNSGPLTLSPEMNYVGQLELSETSGPLEVGTQDPWVTFNLNGSWDFTENTALNFGINNLTDNEPPIWGYLAGTDLNIAVNLYDPMGRSYFVGVEVGL